MNKSISWNNLLLIAGFSFILKFILFPSGIVALGLEVIGVISLISGIAGYVKYKKSLKLKNIETSKENK